jgi:hypothetical protein
MAIDLGHPFFTTYLPLTLLTLALLIGLPIAFGLWHESREEEGDSITDEELLSEFERAHAAGEMGDDEFRRVGDLLKQPRSRTAKELSRADLDRAPQPPPNEATRIRPEAAQDDPPAPRDAP